MADWLGWHWIRADRRLCFAPHIRVEVGHTLCLPDGEMPILCERGFHACKRALNALRYCEPRVGVIACRVRLSGRLIEASGHDKAVASERTVLWMVEADRVLHEFACWCAEAALVGWITRGEAVDPRGWQAIATKRAWLAGDASDGERAATRNATLDAVSNCRAMWAAALWAAAGAASECARVAAVDAARDAVWSGALLAFVDTADGAAAELAAWNAAHAELERRLCARAEQEA